MSESLITKKAIAQGFKELMKSKAFEKITINDITSICGLNRQTFYYHFQDKYELLNWIYYTEIISVLSDNLSFDNYDSKFLEMLQKMKSESYFYHEVLKIYANEAFRNYLFEVAFELFCDIIDKISTDTSIQQSDKAFIAKFFSFGIVGVIIDWAQHGMKQSPEEVTDHLKNLIQDSKVYAFKRYIGQNDINVITDN